jgi:alkaline phosphatase D
MRNLICTIFCFAAFAVNAQVTDRNPTFAPNLKPFYHGVASGQPAVDGFVIWTRLAPDQVNQPTINYYISDTPDFADTLQSGVIQADEMRDYTARIAITGLQSDRYYYYYFRHTEGTSLVGRAKTLPTQQIEHLRFAVVSCARYESGYFNAYGAIARRNDLDAVLHLGDYIYEYAQGAFLPGRSVMPETEAIQLADYRTRYSTYRLDTNLIRMHQQHTVISVWDDHETANDAYKDGSNNHQANEGDWELRKAASRRAYHEWMPIGTPDTLPVYGGYRYGDLANLLMLDTRMDGRDQQPQHFDSPDPLQRKIMSTQQFDWLTTSIKDISARWKILGNQVIFSDVNVGLIAGVFDLSPDPTNLDSIRQAEDTQTDFWEAYPYQRNALLDTLMRYQIPGVVFTTGDSHSSWTFDIAKQPVLYPLQQYNYLPQPNPYVPGVGGYDHVTRAGALAVEFCTPSITSPNFDELIGFIPATIIEQTLNTPVQPNTPAYNPHLKFADLDRHGYIILDVRRDTIQADYFHLATILAANLNESFTVGARNVYGQPGAFLAYFQSKGKTIQAIPAPSLPFGIVSTDVWNAPTVAVGTLFPNPAQGEVILHLIANTPTLAQIQIVDASGRAVSAAAQHPLQVGSNFLPFSVGQLERGVYFVQIVTASGMMVAKWVKG